MYDTAGNSTIHFDSRDFGEAVALGLRPRATASPKSLEPK